MVCDPGLPETIRQSPARAGQAWLCQDQRRIKCLEKSCARAIGLREKLSGCKDCVVFSIIVPRNMRVITSPLRQGLPVVCGPVNVANGEIAINQMLVAVLTAAQTVQGVGQRALGFSKPAKEQENIAGSDALILKVGQGRALLAKQRLPTLKAGKAAGNKSGSRWQIDPFSNGKRWPSRDNPCGYKPRIKS